jgi:uncharacterized paraquat-inducible protein A
MSKTSQQRKSEVLGMPFGTACNQLRRMVMFHLLQRHGENVCFRCGEEILNQDELTIEHKKTWLSSGAESFWDMDNIAFAHAKYNLRAGWVRREVVNGVLWCSCCKQSLPVSSFHKDRHQRTGYALVCRGCNNARRRKVTARGNCRRCGAERGTRPFRASHNVCLECHKVKAKKDN